jgi:hypothetical protein
MASSRLIGFVVAGSLLFSSTAAVASAPTPQQISPWAALTALTGGAPAAALCGSATVAAAQPAAGCVLPATDVPAAAAQSAPPAPIPVPPVESAGPAFGVDPLLLALAAVAGGVGLYFLLRKHHHANSPG